MDGWLIGLFTLLGVLVGGVFTYLGLREQLKQQLKMDSQQWRRKVRSEPLFQLREELAKMAMKAERLAKAGNSLAVSNTEESVKEALEIAKKDWNSYILGDNLQRVLFIQSDEEIVKLVKEIRIDYLDAYDEVVTYKEGQSASELGIALRSSEEMIAPKVAQAQALINTRLEKL
jgi:hypothetical protein